MKKLYIPLEFDEGSAFNILCEVLGMQDIVSSDEELFIHDGAVCRRKEDGEYEVVDERADLFAALRNVACATWPNLEYRGDDYITHYCDGEEEEEEAEWEDCIVRGSPSIRCSICGHESVYEDRYCGGCGCKMKNGY